MGNRPPPMPLQPCIQQLQTAAQRIERALEEASPSVEQLGTAFTAIVSNSRLLSNLTDQQGDNSSQGEMQAYCNKIEHEASRAIVGFQFYDRLSQRLGHVHASLVAIAELLENTDPHPAVEDWEKLVIRIVDTLCLDDDRCTVAGLLGHTMSAKAGNSSQDDNIELF